MAMFIFDLDQILDHRARPIVMTFFWTTAWRIVAAAQTCFLRLMEEPS
jgi:hypothetical protein